MINETLCWDCAKSGKGQSSDCPWARDFTPVDGWKAKKTVKNYRERKVESYLVRKCPLYEKEEEKRSFEDFKKKQAKMRPQIVNEAADDISRIKSEIAEELVGMKGKERAKARRAAFVRRGVCVTCAAAFVEQGHSSCTKCLTYFSERHKKEKGEQKHGT